MARYVGGRIVPTHGGVWDGSKSYEELTIVLRQDTGDSYISKRAVPAGVDIGEEHYWFLYSVYNEQITRAEQHLDSTAATIRSEMNTQKQQVTERMEQAEETVDQRASAAERSADARATAAETISNQNRATLEQRMANIEARQEANVKASTTASADYAAEVVDARVDVENQTHSSLGEHLRSIETGEAISSIPDRKVDSFDLGGKRFFEESDYFATRYPDEIAFSYRAEDDAFTMTALKDVEGDRILYARFLTPREYAQLYRRDGNIRLHVETENVINDSNAFKMALMPMRCENADSETGYIISGSRYAKPFANGSQVIDINIPIRIRGEFETDEDTGCLLSGGYPVSVALLVYGNSPRNGETLTVKGFGGFFDSIGFNHRVTALYQNMISADLHDLHGKVEALENAADEQTDIADMAHKSLALNAYSDCDVLDFGPIYQFAFTDSIGEIVTDEYGDESFTLEYVNNSPMYSTDLTSRLQDSCGEVVVEVTARTYADNGKLRVQLFDGSKGMSHSSHTSYYPVTKDYKRYQFRLVRENSDNTFVGIGPEHIEGNKVQFKDVRILIPHEESKQMPVLTKEFHGYTGEVDCTALEAVTFEDPILIGTDDYAAADGMYLDTIEFYSNYGNFNPRFRIGCIDQYGLFQEVSNFMLHCRRGRNYLKADRLNISVPAGNGVFMQIPPEIALYRGQPAYWFHNLLSRTSVTINENGYSGNPLQETDLFIPLRYTLREKSLQQTISELEERAEDLEALTTRVNVLETGSAAEDVDKVQLHDPDGVKFHLTVDTNGSLHTIRSIPKKALFIGNSLLFGFTTFGMAASDSQHDYYHYVTEFLKSKNPAVVTKKLYGSNWESLTTSEGRQEWIDNAMESTVDGDEDLVVIQLTDNVNSEDRRATYQEDLYTMITAFRNNCPNARIVWLAAWYNSTPDWPYIVKAVEDLHIDLVDIRDISLLAENKNVIGGTYTTDSGEVKTITSAGVASHPGDLGMYRIAQRLIEHLEKYM